jgi:hypothetical protein
MMREHPMEARIFRCHPRAVPQRKKVENTFRLPRQQEILPLSDILINYGTLRNLRNFSRPNNF